MLNVPISFVAAFLLVILLLQLWRSDQGETPLPFLILLAACALTSVVVGLRWGFQLEWARAVQPVLAASLPPLSWVAFVSMLGPLRPRHWGHASGVVLVTLLSNFWRSPLDWVLIALHLGYAVALIRSAQHSSDRLEQVRLGDAGAAQRAVQWVGWMWVASALVDVMIGVNFALNGGQQALTLVTIATSLQLLALGWIMTFLGRTQIRLPAKVNVMPRADAMPAVLAAQPTQPSDPIDDKTEVDGEAQRVVLQAFERLMNEQRLFLDTNLTLDRIARRAVIPARQISAAINAVHGRNVSQVVNEYRVAEAQRLLASTPHSVTEILLDAGFQTKSNFNREFQRVAGMSPSEYRAQLAAGLINAGSLSPPSVETQ